MTAQPTQALAERPRRKRPQLVAMPAGAEFAALDLVERYARALERAIITYRAIPFYPECEDYRAAALKRVNEEMAELREVLGNE